MDPNEKPEDETDIRLTQGTADVKYDAETREFSFIVKPVPQELADGLRTGCRLLIDAVVDTLGGFQLDVTRQDDDDSGD